MSDLASELGSLTAASVDLPPHKTCTVGLTLEKMNDEQREALEPLLRYRSPVSSAKVAEVLSKWGFPVSYQAIQRHRRRENGRGCVCP